MVASKQATKGEWVQLNKQEGPKDEQVQSHKGGTNKNMATT